MKTTKSMKNNKKEASRPSDGATTVPAERPPFDSRDCWGPMCSQCQYPGEAHKPCAVCQDWRRPGTIRRGGSSRASGFNQEFHPYSATESAVRIEVRDEGPRPGDVRLVGGGVGLVLRDWDDGCWLVAPVKPVTDNPTGRCVMVEISSKESGLDSFQRVMWFDRDDPTDGRGLALPALAGTVRPERLGRLLYRVFPEQVANAFRGWFDLIDEPDPPCDWDFDSPHSKGDWDLRRALGPFDEQLDLEDEDGWLTEEAWNQEDAEWEKTKAEARAIAHASEEWVFGCDACAYYNPKTGWCTWGEDGIGPCGHFWKK